MVADCDNLVEIQGLDGAKFLEELDLTGCKSMETLPNLTGCEKLRSLTIRNCKKLTQLQGLEKFNISHLDISDCDSLEAIPRLSGMYVTRMKNDINSEFYMEILFCSDNDVRNLIPISEMVRQQRFGQSMK